MPNNQKGSAVIPIIIGIIVLLVISVIVTKSLGDNQSPSPKEVLQKIQREKPSSSNKPLLLLKSIGVDLDDIVFSKAYLTGFEMPFMGFGFVIPAKFSSTGMSKANPQPTFILPLGTKVYSLVDGIVVDTPKVWSGDYSIQVSADGKLGEWMYETEHVINLKVKPGDKVKAGQVIAEVSDFDKNMPGFGIVEIGILKGGNPPQHICPFAYLDPSIKEEIFAKLKAFYKSWEEYIGNTALYNENESITGCVSMEPIDG